MDDVTAIALLDAFPMLEVLEINIAISLSETFLNKLEQAEQLTRLTLNSDVEDIRPTRAWLADSCRRFPKTLEYLEIYFSGFEPTEDETQGGTRDEYIEFIKTSFRSCLPKLAYVYIGFYVVWSAFSCFVNEVCR